MKTLTKNSMVAGGAVAAFASIYRFLNGTQIWRWRKTRELVIQLQAMLSDKPSEQIEMAITCCRVEHLSMYVDWVSMSHDCDQSPDYYYSDVIPTFVERERQRQIYDLIAERFRAIGNYRKYGHYHVVATALAEDIDRACSAAKHAGYPLDTLLQSIRA